MENTSLQEPEEQAPQPNDAQAQKEGSEDAGSQVSVADPALPPKKSPVSTADKIKFAGLLLFLVLIVIVGLQLFPYFEYLTTAEGRLELIAMIHDAGVAGIGICLALQFVQIVVAFIPGEIVQLAIGAIYGPFAGTFITVLGALISSMFVFFVVRKLGAPFVQGMIGAKNTKILDFFNKDRRLNVIVFILFLIPGLPKDVFTYLVPLTPMRPANFFILSTLGRIPGIAASAFIGNAAVQGDYTQAIIVGIIAGGLGLLGIVFNKQILGLVDRVEDRLAKKGPGSSAKQ